MRTPAHFATVTDGLRIAYFPTQSAARLWGERTASRQYLLFVVPRRLPGALKQIGALRTKQILTS